MTYHNTGNELSSSNLFISPKRNAVGSQRKKEENVLIVGIFKQALRSMNMLFIRGREGKVGTLALPIPWILRQEGGNARRV